MCRQSEASSCGNIPEDLANFLDGQLAKKGWTYFLNQENMAGVLPSSEDVSYVQLLHHLVPRVLLREIGDEERERISSNDDVDLSDRPFLFNGKFKLRFVATNPAGTAFNAAVSLIAFRTRTPSSLSDTVSVTPSSDDETRDSVRVTRTLLMSVGIQNFDVDETSGSLRQQHRFISRYWPSVLLDWHEGRKVPGNMAMLLHCAGKLAFRGITSEAFANVNGNWKMGDLFQNFGSGVNDDNCAEHLEVDGKFINH